MKRHDLNEWSGLIQAWVDDELDGTEKETVEQALEENEDLRMMARAIEEMSDLVRTSVEVMADTVHFEGLWPRISSRIEAAQARAFSPLELQAFADGELSAEAAVTVASKTAAKSTSRSRIASMAEMGDLVRAHVADVTASADFSNLWPRIEAEIGEEMQARSGFQKPEVRPSQHQTGWWSRMLAAFGGYRTVMASVVTAILVFAIMLPFALKDDQPSNNMNSGVNPAVEIRHVVHVEDWQANPGYEVVIDDPHNGTAPVIYIRPEENIQTDESNDTSDSGGLFDNPI